MSDQQNTKIFVFRKSDDCWHIVLQHEDGREEISDQAFVSRKECEEAIKLYAAECRGKISRAQ